MQLADYYDEAQAAQLTGKFLSPEEVRVMITLLKELRDVTLSRGSFQAADDFLSRFTGETSSSRLVPHDVLER